MRQRQAVGQKPPPCCPGSCDELSTVSARFGLSPSRGCLSPLSPLASGPWHPGNPWESRAGPVQTPCANTGCGQGAGGGQGWPWHGAGSGRSGEASPSLTRRCPGSFPQHPRHHPTPPFVLTGGPGGVFWGALQGGVCMVGFHPLSLQRVRMIPTPKRPRGPAPDAGVAGACPAR